MNCPFQFLQPGRASSSAAPAFRIGAEARHQHDFTASAMNVFLRTDRGQGTGFHGAGGAWVAYAAAYRATVADNEGDKT